MRCMNDILGVNGICFGSMVGWVCPSGPRLVRANASGAGPRFWTCICQFLVLLFLPEFVKLSLSHWCPGSGVVLDCVDS